MRRRTRTPLPLAGEVGEHREPGEGAAVWHPLPPLCGDLSREAGEVYY